MAARTDKALRGVDRQAKAWMKANGVPGMCLAVTGLTRTLKTGAYGLSNIDAGRPVTPGTLFQIGSISKSFAALCAVQLAEQGRLDLHRPVKDYLPWFEVRSRHAPITLHHLLTHTSGIVTGSDSLIQGVPEAYSLRHTEASAPPGEHFQYSNAGYKVVGLVLEEVTGQRTPDILSERVLRPLGMSSTAAEITNGLRPRFAESYIDELDDRPRPLDGGLAPAAWIESETADGSISSTPGDMARYLRMLMGRGRAPKGRVVSEESFSLMTRKAAEYDETGGYGYGLVVEDWDGHRLVRHTGGMIGFFSSMVMDMDLGIGVFASINGPGEPERLTRHVLGTIRAAEEGRTDAGMRGQLDPYTVPDAATYAGTYSDGTRKVRFTARGDSLSVVLGRRTVRLDMRSKDAFYAHDPALEMFLLRFGRSHGKVTEVAHGPELFTKEGVRARGTRTSPKGWEAFTGHYRSHNPWMSNFRVVSRHGALVMVLPSGSEEKLHPAGGGMFRIGDDPKSPERIAFDMVVGGKAHRARVNWGEYARTFTP